MARGIYVSDADVEMSKDIESMRIDRHLASDLSSMMPGRRRRMVDRIEEHAAKDPIGVVPVLLKYYDSDDSRVRRQVRESIARVTQSEAGEQALVECMFSRQPVIANNAAAILEERGYNSVNFLSSYRQVESLIMQARKTEVFCKDVEELMLDSIDTYKEGRFDQAMTNMMMAKDLLEDRLEWHGHLRGYIQDVLKLTPMLSRSGVQTDAIQDSIRHASTAMQKREYSDAKVLLELRRQETRLWKQLWSLEEYVTKRITAKPLTELMVLKDEDKTILASFVKVAKEVDAKIQDGDPVGALRDVEVFIRDDVSTRYLTNEGKRLDSKDEASWYTMWNIGLGLLKLVAPIIPNVSEEFYQQYFRDREGSPSIHSVPWPEPFSALSEEDNEKHAKKAKQQKK